MRTKANTPVQPGNNRVVPSLVSKSGASRQNPPSAQTALKPPKLPPFTVVDLTPVQTGTLLAFADVQIGRGPSQFTVCKWRLIQDPGKTAWVSAPQETWTDDTGQRRYKNLFVFPREWKDAITRAVITAWEAHQVQGGAA